MKINHDTESVAGAIGVSAETLAGIMTELMENDMPKKLSMLVELIVGTCRKTVLGDGGEPSSYELSVALTGYTVGQDEKETLARQFHNELADAANKGMMPLENLFAAAMRALAILAGEGDTGAHECTNCGACGKE